MVDIKYERSNEKVNSGQMLILYDRQLECLPSGKVRCCARKQCLMSFIRV